MRSHRVWNNIYAENYANPNSKSFGGEFTQDISVGSSATHSNHFANITVRERAMYGTDWSVFELRLDGELLKRSAFNNKTKDYLPLREGEPAQDGIERAGFVFNKAAA